MRYVVVLPAKDEEKTIRVALESILNQSIPPQLVLVVDDNSTDSTSAILEQMSQRYPSLQYQRTNSSAEYKLGGHVVRLFQDGKKIIDEKSVSYDWIIKMDADVECGPDFMAEVNDRVRDRKVGIVSGSPFYEENGRQVFDSSPSWHTHGQFKIYNAACFDEVGGPKEHLGWDCADNIRAISAGWDCRVLSDVHYQMHRSVGGKSSNKKGRVNHGIGCYITGFDVVYFALKVIHDLFKAPVLLGSMSLIKGYAMAAFRRYDKVLTPDQIVLIRRLLWSSLRSRLKSREFVLIQKLGIKRGD